MELTSAVGRARNCTSPRATFEAVSTSTRKRYSWLIKILDGDWSCGFEFSPRHFGLRFRSFLHSRPGLVAGIYFRDLP